MSRAEAAHSAGLFAPAPRHARGSAFAPRYTATVKGGDSEGRTEGGREASNSPFWRCCARPPLDAVYLSLSRTLAHALARGQRVALVARGSSAVAGYHAMRRSTTVVCGFPGS